MTTVITYGTFDLFHLGHLRLLERAAEYGDRLIVGISTDEFNRTKRKDCVHSYHERARIVEALQVVDVVFPEKSWDQKTKDVQHFQAGVFVMGDDWKGEFDFLKPYCRVVYLPRTEGVSTSDRKDLIENGEVSAEEWTGLKSGDGS